MLGAAIAVTGLVLGASLADFVVIVPFTALTWLWTIVVAVLLLRAGDGATAGS